MAQTGVTNLNSSLANFTTPFANSKVPVQFLALLAAGNSFSLANPPNKPSPGIARLAGANDFWADNAGTLYKWQVYQAEPVQVAALDPIYLGATSPIEGFWLERHTSAGVLTHRYLVPHSSCEDVSNMASFRVIQFYP